MYISDEVVDQVVANNATLQDVVQGRSLMLWRPGQTATLAAQCCMMFGFIATSLAVFWLWPLTLDSFKYYFFAGILPGGATLAWLFNAVVRGKPNARTHIYRYSIATVAISICVALACILLMKNASIGLAAAGLAFNAIAMRLIAGQGYAMISAMFRAQRAYAELGKQQ
jgi:hypothetical protein